MENKIAFILNYAPHYRLFIYKGISESINADFYFGNLPGTSIKKCDYTQLKNFKKEFITIKFKKFYWHIGSVFLIFKPYKRYVLTGDPYILSNWVLLLLAKLLGRETYLWTHGWYGKESGISGIIKKNYFRFAKSLLLYGNYSKELLIKEGFDEKNIVVVYNSLDYNSQVTIRKNLVNTNLYKAHFTNEFPVLFYIGRIQESKKLDQILQAMNILRDQGINTNLAIIGGLDQNYNFKEIIERLNLQKNVWLVGPLYDEKDIANYIYNANVCVSPGNIGLTAIHSLVYGTPVITHDNFKNQMPEFESIINGVNGFFFKENDVFDLATTIQDVLNKKFNRLEVSKIVDDYWNPNNQISIFKNKIDENIS